MELIFITFAGLFIAVGWWLNNIVKKLKSKFQ